MIVELPYTLHTRKKSIALAWTVLLIPPIPLNLGLFYGLWYGRPELDRLLVLQIPVAVLGLFTIIPLLQRIYLLTQPAPIYRPVSSPRLALDIFQWGYIFVLLCTSALINYAVRIGPPSPETLRLQLRLISLLIPLVLFLLAVLTLLSLLIAATKIPLPFRFGSVPAGNPLRPALYYILEDVIAVDGDGQLAYRVAFKARYETSKVFRRMIWVLSIVWMMGFFVVSLAIGGLVGWVVPDWAVYAVGWCAALPFAGAGAVGTTYYVKSRLRAERELDGQGGEVADGEREPLLR